MYVPEAVGNIDERITESQLWDGRIRLETTVARALARAFEGVVGLTTDEAESALREFNKYADNFLCAKRNP